MLLKRPFALLALLIGSWSCGAAGPATPVLELARAKAIWNASAIPNYEYVVANQCFCGFGGVPVRIVVENGVVTSMTILASGQPVPPTAASAYHDINGLFLVIDDAIRRNAAVISAEYSPVYGFPSSVFIDYVRSAADEEFGFEVQSFLRR